MSLFISIFHKMALTFDIIIQNDCHGNIVCALEHPGISDNLFWDTVNILGTRRLTGNIHLEHMTYLRNLPAYDRKQTRVFSLVVCLTHFYLNVV